MSDETGHDNGKTGGLAGFGADIPELEAERPEPDAEEGASAEAAATAGGRPGSRGAQAAGIEAVMNVNLDVQVVLGECRMPISNLLKLGRGSVIELDQRIGEPVSIVINDRLVARGDLVKLPEDRIGVSLTEIVVEHPASVL